MYLTSSGAGVLGTFLPNLSAALSWGIVAGSVSEPGRNQEESGEKLLRKLMRSQVFSEVFRASLRFQPGKPRFQPRFRWGFSGVLLGFRWGFARESGVSRVVFGPLDRLSSGGFWPPQSGFERPKSRFRRAFAGAECLRTHI